MQTKASTLHADLDGFYALVQQLLDPSLRGKPIAVGGRVVLAASYEARGQ
jgi:DNA polymerase-4